MSKFVTYPAVTVLDNDHSLLIDDPNAGTNSITAENAGNTLLSKWSGFDTFDEAVKNTIEHSQEFIDRDTAIREETADLKRKIVTTFPAKDASGQIATFDSEFEDAPLKSCIVQVEPVQDLHGYDHPWPAGGGVNILSMLKPSYSGTATNKYYVELSYNARDFNQITLVAGQTYTLSFDIHTSVYPCFFSVGCGNGNYNQDIANDPSTPIVADGRVSITFTPTEAQLDERPYFAMRSIRYVRATTFDWSVKNIQLELGSTATSWTPYENICPISGFTGVEVQRTGVNVWDEEWEIGTISSSTGETISDPGRIRSKNYIPCVPSSAYCFTKVNVSNTTDVRPFFYDASKNFISVGAWSSINTVQNTPSNCHYMKFICATGYGTTYNHDISINYPSTDADYHPYVGQTYPITFPSEAGAVYGAYIDVTGGELVVDRAIFRYEEFTGNLSSDATSEYGYIRFVCVIDKKIGTTNVLSNLFRTYNTIIPQKPNFEAISGFSSGTGLYISINVSRLSGDLSTAGGRATALKNWSRENGLYICYELAEPIRYPLTPTEIKTLLGQNNLWANTGDISVEYLMSDVGWYVEKKLRAFQSILAGVEDSAVASKNYSTDSYLIFNNDIYRVTKTITAGETIEDGVNVTKTTVAEQLMALAQV